MTAGYESREYDRLVKRKFKPYSKGHRMMYEHAIDTIKDDLGFRQARPTKKWRPPQGRRIVEAGFGIGWGLERMLAEGIVSEYHGFEPNHDSFMHVFKRNPGAGSGALLRFDESPFPYDQYRLIYEQEKRWFFDEAFCIEVIEHVPMEEHLPFLKGLRACTPRLWFSTPDKDRVPAEGVRTRADWERLLGEAGFRSVNVNTSHWTYLYECQ